MTMTGESQLPSDLNWLDWGLELFGRRASAVVEFVIRVTAKCRF